tara:strand:+ start:1768 stop:2088 length:321 start_codon:yes stop_codon:yes gene_type:complete
MASEDKDKVIYSKQELENSNRIFKSATPKYDLSWYVKWTASAIMLVAMSFRGAQVLPQFDLLLSFVGCLGWLWVGVLWKDRALIILNAVAVVILFSGLLKLFIGEI